MKRLDLLFGVSANNAARLEGAGVRSIADLAAVHEFEAGVERSFPELKAIKDPLLRQKVVDADDPRTITVSWYKHLLETARFP